MGIEVADNAGVLESDERGIPRRITNWRDVQRATAMPPPKVFVNTPPGYSHAAPDTGTPYLTGPASLPTEEDDHE